MDATLRELERLCAKSPSTSTWAELARARLRAGQVLPALEAVRKGYAIEGGDLVLDRVRDDVLLEWWKVARWREVLRVPGGHVEQRLFFAPHGETLTVATWGFVQVREVEGGAVVDARPNTQLEHASLELALVEDDLLILRDGRVARSKLDGQRPKAHVEILGAERLSTFGKRGLVVARAKKDRSYLVELDLSRRSIVETNETPCAASRGVGRGTSPIPK